MHSLNYHHLLYFWAVAKHGSVAQASRELRLAHPTVSAQIHRLEDVLGEKLFSKKGRNLVLTEAGRVAFHYADEIFSLGREFVDTIQGRLSGKPIRVVVGCSDALPKTIVQRILAPAWRLEEHVRVVCREDNTTQAYLGELAANAIDVVLSDTPALPGAVRVFSHLLGECGTVLLAAPALAKSYERRFPDSLTGMPFLLPGPQSTLRRGLEQWFDAHELRPRVVGEFDDPALANVVAEAGLGVCAVPEVIAEDIRRRHRLQSVGRVESLRQRFYAISAERKIKNPAVVAICEGARKDIFAPSPQGRKATARRPRGSPRA
ncbi:MAG TPA: LysR family transcriptional regulator [Polyangiaceae bacterium]|nr:LysR family transcriptional regulator [Polyangiaceae bacterium]